jgi:hypothetical protein
MTKVTNVGVKPFVLRELAQLKQELHEVGTKASGGDIAGALILAARRSPVEAVAAVVQTYVRREAAEAAEPSESDGGAKDSDG